MRILFWENPNSYLCAFDSWNVAFEDKIQMQILLYIQLHYRNKWDISLN